MMAAHSDSMRGSMCPCQFTNPGSRTPPSHTEPLPSRNGPAEPPLRPRIVQGPLSEEKKIAVLLRSPVASSELRMSPTSQSSSASTSPKSPRLLTPQNFCEA